MNDDEPLPSDIAGALRAERTSPGAPPGTKARVATRLGWAFVGAGGGEGTAPASRPSASRTPDASRTLARTQSGSSVRVPAFTFFAGALVGGAVVAAILPALRVRHSDHAIAPLAPTAAAPSALATASVPPAALQPLSPAPRLSVDTIRVPVALPVPSVSNDNHTLAAEQAVLDTARVALGRGDAAAALVAANRHAQRFPSGSLTEEREAIAIQALVLLGRDGEARTRADRFKRAHPTSALLSVIDESLGR